jgi:cardiolipin synthase (CMP-forming)
MNEQRRHHFRKQIPNWLTISRVVVILPICLLLAFGDSPTSYSVATVLSTYAMITDYFDGYLSRKWQAVSDLGRLLDPVADKLLVAALLILLSAKGFGHPLAVTAIMLREIFISGLREFMQEKQIIIHVSVLAKYKTATQMLACFLLLLAGALPDITWMHMAGSGVLWIAAALTIITGIDYINGARKQW